MFLSASPPPCIHPPSFVLLLLGFLSACPVSHFPDGRCYTQNIDGLERIAGIPADALVEAHGSFAAAHCIDCAAEADIARVKAEIDSDIIPRCTACNGLVKPDIVFFGEGLPQRFVDLHKKDMESADAVLVIGTSLQVQPFSNLPHMVSDHVPRLLINREAVGPFVCPCANPTAAQALSSHAHALSSTPSSGASSSPNRDPLFPTGAARSRLPAITEGLAGEENGENWTLKAGKSTTPPGRSSRNVVPRVLARSRSERVVSSSGSARDPQAGRTAAVPVRRSLSMRGLREGKDKEQDKDTRKGGAGGAGGGAGAGGGGARALRRVGSMGKTAAAAASRRVEESGPEGTSGVGVGSRGWTRSGRKEGGREAVRGGAASSKDSAQSAGVRRGLKLPGAQGGGGKKVEVGERSTCDKCGRWVYRDVLLLGDCDQEAQRLAKALGYKLGGSPG
eukprot:2250949-Rhodomonas_salina.1